MLSKVLRSLRPALPNSRRSKIATLAVTLTFAGLLNAQTVSSSAGSNRVPVDRLTQPIQENNRVTLQGTLHPLANKVNDRGAVADGMKLERIQVVLKRSDGQESALKQLIGDLHTPGSASYHKWLTPEDFGKQFGPSDADLTKLEGWLGSHGFSITKLNAGRQTLEIAGTAGQFRDTFHSQIHTYQVKGETGSLETHFANASAPEIPAAVAPVFGGFTKLNNFRLKSHAHVLGKAQYNEATHESKPEWTYTGFGSTDLVLAPADLAVQYDLNPLYTASTPINGTGQSIAIVNESNINIALVNNYRKLFNLPVNPPQIIIDGNDPGIDGINSPYGRNGASFEAYLDVEVAGAVAPNAQVNLVIADSTALDDGLTLAIERAVYSNISPVISLSFGGCEINQGSFNATISGLWEQAAAQGITVLVSTGDSGSAGCDDDNSQYFAVGGQAVNGLGSTPYNVAVGGTDFYYSGGSANLATYWNLTPTNNTPTVSLKSKVPEQPFNSSQYGLNLQNYYANSGDTATTIFAASGGASTCGVATVDSNGDVTACAPYPKPSWQTGFGDSARDLPDVSMFGALASSDSYTPICAEDGDCEAVASTGTVQISGVGGTSVSAPTFAGVMALVNQKYGPQGQANYVLYPLAKQFPSAFNDVVAGTNSVPCAIGTVDDADNGGAAVTSKNCQTVTSPLLITDNRYGTATEGEIGLTANTPAYSASVGYDLASGLGSIDVNNLVTNWGSVKVGTTTTTLTTSSASFAHGTPVTISGSVTGASPTGDVAVLTTSTDASQQGAGYFTLSSGSYSGSIDTLPGGTYNVSGHYGGDGSNAASTSAPVSITVAPESSKTLLQVFSAANTNSNLAPITSGTSYTYGIPLILSAQPTNSSGKVSTIPTGSVAFSDSATVLNTAVVNVQGDAEYNGTLAPGSHSITAAYSGDGSYNSSTSSAVTFSVAKDTPVISAIDYDVDQYGENIVTSTGAIFTVLVENSVSFTGLPIAAPSGTLTLTGGPTGTTASATLTPGFDPNSGSPAGIAIFTVPAGVSPGSNYTFSFSYAGDTNYNAAAKSIAETFDSYTGGLTSTTTATATATATSPAAGIQVTVTVAGPSGSAAPTGAVLVLSSGAYDYNLNELVYITGANLPASTGNSVTVTLPPLNSANLYQGSNQITVQYLGDNNYYPSATTLSLSNPLSDFTLVPLTTTVNVPSTGVDTDTLEVGSTNGFAGAVALSCAGAGGVTCSVNPSSASVAAAGSTPVTVNINTAGVSAAGTYNVVITGTDSTGNFIHTVGLQVVTPKITIQAFTVSNSAAIAVTSQGGTGSSTVSVTPTNGFTGTVALTCAVTASPSGATEVPTCSLSPASATLTAAAAVTSTLTINTTAQTTGSLHLPRRGFLTAGGGVTLATLLCLGLGASASRRGRRALRAVRALRILALAPFFALVAGAGVGCGGGSSSGSGSGSGGGGGSTGGTTTGAYTVTVTGTSGTTTATTTVGLTVN